MLARVESVHVILSLLLLSAAGVYWHKVCYHVRVVERGRLIRSGELGRVGLWWMWRRHGIRTVVNLMSEPEHCRETKTRWEKQFCREKGIEWVHLPMIPGMSPGPRQVHRFLEICRSGDRRPVLVHCKQGVVRTNIMVAVYMNERFGLPNEEILRGLPLFGHTFHGPRYEKVREFVLSYEGATDGRGRDTWDRAGGVAMKRMSNPVPSAVARRLLANLVDAVTSLVRKSDPRR
ncbi:MAG TPA: hypothetical protein VLI39_15895 [Sedimentisphaerales bacterium]|nr:hypothetical protein [Sedimentisphaerales bacterium]